MSKVILTLQDETPVGEICITVREEGDLLADRVARIFGENELCPVRQGDGSL